MEGIKNLNLNVNVTVFAPETIDRKKTAPKIFRGRIYSKEESENNLIIQIKEGNGSDLLQTGKPIFLFLAHDLGLYIYTAMITGKKVEDGDIIVNCRQPRQLKNFQRRQSVRVKVNIPVSYADLTGTVTDISLEGIQLQSPGGVNVGAELDLKFQLDNIGPIYVKGNVVRSFEKDKKLYFGIKFSDIDKQTKDDIARFIITEQVRQKRLGLQIFSAFVFNATVKVNAPAEFSIIQYKNLDVSALQSKKSKGTITEVGIHGLSVECPLKMPIGAILEFAVDLPKMGYTVIQAVIRGVDVCRNSYIIYAEYNTEYEKIRDCILDQMAGDFDLPDIRC
jgi:c-di-GMP-binding flagellar brake protein YcgR